MQNANARARWCAASLLGFRVSERIRSTYVLIHPRFIVWRMAGAGLASNDDRHAQCRTSCVQRTTPIHSRKISVHGRGDRRARAVIVVAVTVATLSFGALSLGASVAATRKIPAAPKEFRLHGDAKKGEPTFIQYCASCHGKHGDGRGIVGKTLTPPPADFNDAERMAAISDWEIYLAISAGGASVELAATMPAWGSALKEEEIHNVAAYVKTFAAEKQGKKAP